MEYYAIVNKNDTLQVLMQKDLQIILLTEKTRTVCVVCYLFSKKGGGIKIYIHDCS